MFSAHVVLARIMGASSYGNFAYALTWLNILVLFGKLGLDTASLRFVAEYNGTGKWGLMKGFLRRSIQFALAASALVSVSTAMVIWFIQDRLNAELAAALWLVCLILPLYSLLLVRSAALRSLKKVIKAQSGIKIVRPAVLICGVGCVYLLSSELLDATIAMAMELIAFAGSLLFVAVYLKKSLPRDMAAAKHEYISSTWARVALPMLLISAIMQTQNQVDILIIGFFLGSGEVGIYAAAKKITMLIAFGLSAVNIIAAPMISELWHQDKRKELQHILTLAARGIFAFTLPVSLIMVIFGKQVLSLFGPEFTAAYGPLVVLAAGQIVNSLAGVVGLIMNMTGYQNNLFIIVGICVLLNILLSILLIPVLGLYGAALSVSCSLIVMNALMLIYVAKILKLNPSILSIGAFKQEKF
jgi:O-antigen/teichoic acid export membrane protein